MNVSRKISLSAAGAVFCLLVIFIHVASPVITGADRQTAAYAAVLTAWRLSAFVVQGFILLAGIKLGLKISAGKIAWSGYYLSRLTRVVLPYVAWVVVYYLWFLARGYFEFSPSALLRYIFVGDLSAHFYFVVAVVQFYLLAPAWKALTDRVPAAFALPAAALVSLLSAQYLPYMLDYFCGIKDFAFSDRVFTTYLVWWVAGLYIGRDWDAFAVSLKRGRWVYFGAALLAGVSDALLCYNSYVSGVIFGYAEPVHMLYCVCAIMFALSLGDLARDGSAAARLLRAVDRAGYGIYLSHVLILSAVTAALDAAGVTRLTARFLISATATYALAPGLSIAYDKFKARLLKRKTAA